MTYDALEDAAPTVADEAEGAQIVLRWLIRAAGIDRGEIETFQAACRQSAERLISGGDFAGHLPEIRASMVASSILGLALHDHDTFAGIAATAEAQPGENGAH